VQGKVIKAPFIYTKEMEEKKPKKRLKKRLKKKLKGNGKGRKE